MLQTNKKTFYGEKLKGEIYGLAPTWKFTKHILML